ncbi:MAG: phosphotransferase [Anaerolineae bacterium]
MTFSDDQRALAAFIQLPFPQAHVLRTWELQGGLSAQMRALELVLPDGEYRRVVVRCPGAVAFQRDPDNIAREFRLLKVLDANLLSVPASYYLGDIDGTPAMVTQFVDGVTEFSPVDVGSFISQFAAQLAKIHHIDSMNNDLSFLPRSSDTFHAGVNRLVTDHTQSPIGLHLREYLSTVAEQQPVNNAALLHGDYWPGNLLWNEGKLVAIVDWEDAELGDPLIDFAISRLDTLLVFGVQAMNDFTEHYRAVSTAHFNQLPYWDMYAALRAAPHLAEWSAGYPQLGRPDVTETSMRERLEWFAEQALLRAST